MTLVLYSVSTLVPPLPPRLALTAHFLHALTWRMFHSFGIGLLLRAQSKTKWLVRHYLKHYHYPGDASNEANDGHERESVVRRATEEAFGNWQVGYNLSLVMTYGACLPRSQYFAEDALRCRLRDWLGRLIICPSTGPSAARSYGMFWVL
jgi:hypothetical protein